MEQIQTQWSKIEEEVHSTYQKPPELITKFPSVTYIPLHTQMQFSILMLQAWVHQIHLYEGIHLQEDKVTAAAQKYSELVSMQKLNQGPESTNPGTM